MACSEEPPAAKRHELCQGVTVALQQEPQPSFVITGLDLEQATSAIKITVVPDDQQRREVPPMLGRFVERDQSVVFEPRFPLSPALEYRVELIGELANQSQSRISPVFQLPKPAPQPQVYVTEVFPSSDTLPENLLKFYIHFSGPMSRGEAYQHVRLLHGADVVDRPFLELGEELWDAGQTRFTLFIHPGRIKRGLKPREEDGPAMVAGEEYSLEIDKRWVSADGQPLKDSYRKRFTVVEPDHQQLNPESWKIETPTRDSRLAVLLKFDEPLDHAMLMRVLSVQRRDGSSIHGKIQVSEHETQWSFTPDQDWEEGIYEIRIATNLEDRSGNSVARPFETKMQERAASQPSTHIAVEFIVN